MRLPLTIGAPVCASIVGKKVASPKATSGSCWTESTLAQPKKKNIASNQLPCLMVYTPYKYFANRREIKNLGRQQQKDAPQSLRRTVQAKASYLAYSRFISSQKPEASSSFTKRASATHSRLPLGNFG